MYDRGSIEEAVAQIRSAADAVRGGREAPEALARVVAGNAWRLHPEHLCDMADAVVARLSLPEYRRGLPPLPAAKSPIPIASPDPKPDTTRGSLFPAPEQEPW